MATSTLQAIRDKVRRITRSPSEGQLTTAQLDEYINTFVLQDFPEHLRLFNLHTVLEFYTTPFVADYDTTLAPVTDPLYDFKNKYISVSGPVYFAGVQGQLVQDRNTFFTYYPQNTSQQLITTGDNSQTVFTGTISATPLLQGSILFNSYEADGTKLALIDYPVSPLVGALGIPDEPQTIPSPYGSVNYQTGAFSLNFPAAPASGAPINSQFFAYQANRPIVMLFYDGVFSMRPVPDQVYKITLNAFVRPTELLTSGQEPKLNEWWTFIAFGAARKVFEDRLDLESIGQLQPLFDEQMALIQRRTLVQNSTQRVATIYQYANSPGAINGWNGFGQF